jgi:hypothetical protein
MHSIKEFFPELEEIFRSVSYYLLDLNYEMINSLDWWNRFYNYCHSSRFIMVILVYWAIFDYNGFAFNRNLEALSKYFIKVTSSPSLKYVKP